MISLQNPSVDLLVGYAKGCVKTNTEESFFFLRFENFIYISYWKRQLRRGSRLFEGSCSSHFGWKASFLHHHFDSLSRKMIRWWLLVLLAVYFWANTVEEDLINVCRSRTAFPTCLYWIFRSVFPWWVIHAAKPCKPGSGISPEVCAFSVPQLCSECWAGRWSKTCRNWVSDSNLRLRALVRAIL